MRKFIAATAFVAASLAASASFAENAASESRARLAKLWGTGQTQTVATTPAPRTNVSGMTETRGSAGTTTGTWTGNYRAGRVHPPAGR